MGYAYKCLFNIPGHPKTPKIAAKNEPWKNVKNPCFFIFAKIKAFFGQISMRFPYPGHISMILSAYNEKNARNLGGVFWDISLSRWWVNFGHPLQNTLYQPYGWSYHSTPCTGGKPISTAFRNGAKLFPTPNGLRVRSNFVKEINFCKSLIFTPNLTPGREYWLWTAPKCYKSHKNLISRPPTYR